MDVLSQNQGKHRLKYFASCASNVGVCKIILCLTQENHAKPRCKTKSLKPEKTSIQRKLFLSLGKIVFFHVAQPTTIQKSKVSIFQEPDVAKLCVR